MKILFIQSVSSRGGTETVLLSVLKAVGVANFEAKVAILDQPGQLSTDISQLGFPLFYFPVQRYRFLHQLFGEISKLVFFVKKHKITLIQSNGTKAHIVGSVVSLLTRVPNVWHLHDILSESSKFDRLAIQMPVRFVIANSLATKKRLLELKPGLKQQVEVCYPCVDTEHFNPGKFCGSHFRKIYNIKEDATIISLVGRFQTLKGQHILLLAAKELLDKRPDLVFLFVGNQVKGIDDGYETKIQQLYQQLGLGKQVIFTGFLPNVAEALAATDIVVQPSLYRESFGLAAAEALAMGKAVVATDVGAVSEVITHGQEGLLIEPNNPSQLASAIEWLIQHPEECKLMGQRGQKKVKESFSPDKFNQIMVNIYKNLS